ncbi:MAG: sensor histidine kinase [Candidatus Dormibacteraceae bacterium]
MASQPVGAHARTRARPGQAEIEADVRRLVARELHDRVAQTLTGMLVDLENFKAEQVSWDDVLRQMDTIQDSTRQVLQSLRQLLHDLRGDDAVGDRFVDAVGMLVARFEAKTHIAVQLQVLPGWPEALTPPASVNLYRIIEEALANVRMHSGARAVTIVLESAADSRLSVVVVDDGRGVDIHETRPVGLGTVGMKERALFLGGDLKIESGTGDGTTVRATFPEALLTAKRSAAHQIAN